jgi:hypothetical protein
MGLEMAGWLSIDRVYLQPLRATAASPATADDAVAPWWPFTAAAMPEPGDLPRAPGCIQPADPDHPDAVLDGLEPLDVTVAGVPFHQLVRIAYHHLATTDGEEDDPR